MKKILKIILSLFFLIILCIVIDLVCIFNFNRPLFAIRENNGDSFNIVYRGIFYDTYNCGEFSMAQIKSKSSKFNCSATEDNLLNKVDVNWYIELDEENNYILCDNEDKDIDSGICYIGTYAIPNGDVLKNVTIELYLDHYYKNGDYIAVDLIGPTILNLERDKKYKGDIISIEKQTNKIYYIKLFNKIKYNFE